ncbi:MAG: hypothetical protein HRU25_11340 [Psychrobium sp.]|nr:hypothetical protein [Psychrobium sp.]
MISMLIILFSMGIISMFIVEHYNKPKVSTAKTIEEALHLIAEGKLSIAPLKVVYDDLHGFHGGLTLSIFGDGSTSQKSRYTEISPSIKRISERK